MSQTNPPSPDTTAAHEREQPEPHEEQNFPSLLLLFLCSVLVFASAVYFQRYSGNFSSLVYNEEVQGSGGGGAAGPVAAVDPVAAGKKIFAINCVTCHQASGQGLPGAYPPLAGSEWVVGNEEALVRILLHGLGGPVTVKGATFNGAMPSFGPLGSNWKDDKIAYVLSYIRQEWGNKAPPVTKETVARIRTATASRNKAWTAAELAEFHQAK
jgi:mono/diheme cytochrome c family protein